ncbi:MAG: UTP--glucose-1-phosphate uridylyltransferase [Actinomycetota bacterium]
MPVRVAVIPAAGLGTRFLPVTKAVPKELLPVFDTPSLQHTVDEAAHAGIEEVIIISNRAKPAIETFAQHATGNVRVRVVYQDSPRGLGQAVECAREAVGDAPFAVLLPDELMGDSSHLRDLITEHDRSGKSAIGLKNVPRNEVSAYGCVTPQGVPDATGRVGVRDVVEKPNSVDAPSDLVIIGRYVFSRDIWGHLASLKPATGGELQLSDAVGSLARKGGVVGVLVNCSRHDTGTPLGMLTASVDAALRRKDVSPALRAWLERRLSS